MRIETKGLRDESCSCETNQEIYFTQLRLCILHESFHLNFKSYIQSQSSSDSDGPNNTFKVFS